MYILTFESFVDIFSFESLMLAYNKGQANFYCDEKSLKNGIISACPITERNMKAYKLKGDLVDISLDNLKSFNKFNNLIMDKHILFNQNCINLTHSLYAKQSYIQRPILNFFTDEENRNKNLLIFYYDDSIDLFLNNAGYEFIFSNNNYFIISDSVDDAHSILLYLKLNEVNTSYCVPSIGSFKNYDINIVTIDLE